MIRTIKISESSEAIGQTVMELDLRYKTGSTLIAIYRDQKGVLQAKADSMLQMGDVLYLIGDEEGFDKAAQILQ